MVNVLSPRSVAGAVLSQVATRAAQFGQILTATDGRDILLNDPDGWEVEQPGLWFMGPAGSDGTGGPFGHPPPGADQPGQLASLPAVTRCTSIICDTLAALPWQLLRGDYERLSVPAWIEDPQLLRPDGRMGQAGAPLPPVRLSAVEFWAQWITHALWWGDAYLYVPVRDATGAPLAPLWQLNPLTVKHRAGQFYVGDSDEPMAPGEIIHLRGAPPYKNGHGNGVLTRHLADLGLAVTVREWAAGAYRSGLPLGYLKSSQPHMDSDQAADLKRKWMEQHGGSRRSIAVLNATTDFTPIAVSPIDAQLDQARQWSMRDVAMAFGVPPYMLAVPGDSSTYANVIDRARELRQFTLLPWLRRIESCLSAQFPAGTQMKILTAGLERADTQTRYAAYKIALDAGVMTRDEVRALEDLPPLGPRADVTLPDDHADTLPALLPVPPAPNVTDTDPTEEGTADE